MVCEHSKIFMGKSGVGCRGANPCLPTMKKKYVIGIDPDSDKSGIGVVDTEQRKVVYMDALRFPALINTIKDYSLGGNAIVYVEAGWLNASNWHTHKGDSPWLAAKKGVGVGMNQMVGKLIIEVCEANHIAVLPIKPLRKCWNSRDKKITHTELDEVVGGLPDKRSNQEARDAALIAWVCAP